jgi:hypothetical protein
MARLDSDAAMAHLSRMLLGPPYLRKKLARPLPIEDATRLQTLADAVAYMTALPPHQNAGSIGSGPAIDLGARISGKSAGSSSWPCSVMRPSI